eukprot:GEMP01019859.1.p1 GENE.GEMP01019859.1~~GEMP01019859.1.p1  ORF type:complete len:810 (+),score=182.03 GEMP01019859.1:136-2565(+)
MALSDLGQRRIRFIDDGLQLLTCHYLAHIQGISENNLREALAWSSSRLHHTSLLSTAPADVEIEAKAMVEKLKVHAHITNADYLRKLFDRAFRPKMRDFIDTKFAADVPHALVKLLIQLARRPTDMPLDFAAQLSELKRTSLAPGSESSLSEWESLEESGPLTDAKDDSMSDLSDMCDDASVSESAHGASADSEAETRDERGEIMAQADRRIKEARAPEEYVEFTPESVPLPVFFTEVKRGHHATVPEDFIVEDTILLLLGLDADVAPASVSISTLRDKSLSALLETFQRYAHCLGELRALSETLRLVLPPIEDYLACQHVTELWQCGQLTMSNLGALPRSPTNGRFGSQPAFGPCWGGFRDGVDALLLDFDNSLSTPHRSLIFLREAIRPRMRVLEMVHRLVEDVFSTHAVDSEEMRVCLIAKLSEHLNVRKELIPLWKKVLQPLYDAMTGFYAFNSETAGVIDFAPFPISMYPVPAPRDDPYRQPSADEVLDVIRDIPSELTLSRAATPLRELTLNASKKQAATWLAVPDGPLRQALACFHAVALCWNAQVLQSMVHFMARDVALNVALQKSIEKALRYETPQGEVLRVPASISLEWAENHLSASGSLSNDFRLQWNGDPSFKIFDCSTVAQYSRIMELLLLVHWTLSLVPRAEGADSNFRANGCMLCAEMRHFLTCLRQFLALTIEEASNKFERQLEEIRGGNAKGESIKHIAVIHEEFLHDMLEGCVLLPEFQSIFDNICGVMTVIRDFSTTQKHVENVASDFRMRVAFLIKALKWSVAARGLSSSQRVLNLVQIVNYNNFYVDM